MARENFVREMRTGNTPVHRKHFFRDFTLYSGGYQPLQTPFYTPHVFLITAPLCIRK
jgi:hypothetical protein